MGLTNMKGDIAELAVAKRFLELGYWVSMPFGDDAPYDLLVDIDGEIKRVQVKHLKPYKDTIRFRMYSDTGRDYREVVDIMVGYNSEDGNCYMIKPKDFELKSMLSLKLNKPKNNQTKGINLAENYKI